MKVGHGSKMRSPSYWLAIRGLVYYDGKLSGAARMSEDPGAAQEETCKSRRRHRSLDLPNSAKKASDE
jgi:hypothetical protein